MSCSWDIEDRFSHLSYLDYRKTVKNNYKQKKNKRK